MQTAWGALQAPLLHTFSRILSFAPRLLIAVLFFVLFYAAAALARRIVRRSAERLPRVPWTVGILLSRSVYFAIILIGILAALSAVNIEIATFLEALGIAGLVLGFALKDALENFLSGILLLIGRPFELGHQVTLGEFEGTVTDIQIRTTTLTTYDNETVIIPNSRVYTNPVINHTALGSRRYEVSFATSLKADTAFVLQEALRSAAESPEVASEPAPSVRIAAIDAPADILDWRLYYWAPATKAAEITTKSEVLGRIKQRLYDVGVPAPTATSATILLQPQSDSAPEETSGDLH